MKKRGEVRWLAINQYLGPCLETAADGRAWANSYESKDMLEDKSCSKTANNVSMGKHLPIS